MDALTRRGFLSTRIARRVLLAFMACALLPVGLLAVITHRQVSRNLLAQSEARLREETKTAGMAMVQRLMLLDAELVVLAQAMAAAGVEERAEPTPRFERVRLIRRDDPAFGRLPAASRARLTTGEPVLLPRSEETRSIGIARAVSPADSSRFAVGDISGSYLAEAAPPSRDGGITCIFDERRVPVACPSGIADRVAASLPPGGGRGRVSFRFPGDGSDHLAAAWTIFLGASFGGATWTAVASERYSNVYGPVREFQRLFVLAVAFAVVGVLLLSHVQIRRSLRPVTLLQEGTRRIGARDFDARVAIASGDEFEDLGTAFNGMASSLGLQFRALAARAEVDRAVLSSLDEPTIIGTVLARGRGLVPCSAMAVVRYEGGDAVAHATSEQGTTFTRWTVAARYVDAVRAAPSLLTSLGSHEIRHLVPAALLRDAGSWTVAPLRHDGGLAGWLLFRHDRAQALDRDALDRIRGLADQVAIALAKARLVKDLDELRWGALHALARAVDAKSAWTAGHSDRVTGLAVSLGARLGLGDADLDRLRRGALVHDVGKIGVSADILDKPARLSREEEESMRAHVTIGARILEPIARFDDVIPIVLHHHEKHDGSGYPLGLAGADIPYLARIVAVADVFDALTSDRPYRRGLSRDAALAIIRSDVGSAFDPAIADAFIAMIEEDGATPSIVDTALFAAATT